MRKLTQLAVLTGTTITLIVGPAGAASADVDDLDGCTTQFVDNVTYSPHDPVPQAGPGQELGDFEVDASETVRYALDSAGDVVIYASCVA